MVHKFKINYNIIKAKGGMNQNIRYRNEYLDEMRRDLERNWIWHELETEPFDIRMLQDEIYFEEEDIDIPIHEDDQNIHNHEIQQTVLESYNKIIDEVGEAPPENEIIQSLRNHPIMKEIETYEEDDSNNCKGLKNFLIMKSECNIIHTVLKITFAQGLWYVFERTKINENKAEIIKALCQEIIQDRNQNKCYTGSITRIINSLNVIDPLVQINIESINQKINRLLEPIYDKFINQNNDKEENTSSYVMTNKTKFENEAIEVLQQNNIKITQDIIEKYIKPLTNDL